jgi:trk system potassium uptake protein TrkA
MNISPIADDVIQSGDVLVIVGKNDDLAGMERAYLDGR